MKISAKNIPCNASTTYTDKSFISYLSMISAVDVAGLNNAGTSGFDVVTYKFKEFLKSIDHGERCTFIN